MYAFVISLTSTCGARGSVGIAISDNQRPTVSVWLSLLETDLAVNGEKCHGEQGACLSPDAHAAHSLRC